MMDNYIQKIKASENGKEVEVFIDDNILGVIKDIQVMHQGVFLRHIFLNIDWNKNHKDYKKFSKLIQKDILSRGNIDKEILEELKSIDSKIWEVNGLSLYYAGTITLKEPEWNIDEEANKVW